MNSKPSNRASVILVKYGKLLLAKGKNYNHL